MDLSSVTDGRYNRLLGWLLLTVVFALSVGLDPWTLLRHDVDSFPRAQLARHAQVVALGMAFFQILVGRLLARLETGNAVAVSALSMVGSLMYFVGYLCFIVAPTGAMVAAVGAALNALAIFLLLPARFPESLGAAPRVAVLVLCGGMLLDLSMALLELPLPLSLPDWTGQPTSVQMRMLRLARAAMIALPLLALLYAELRERSRPVHWLLEWAGPVGVFGAATMSLILVLSACVWMPFKYLLGLPANAAVAGVIAGAVLAWRNGLLLELIGWLLVLLSMSAGLLMGLYAFDGPVPDPPPRSHRPRGP
jgi:hypothetical protein